MLFCLFLDMSSPLCMFLFFLVQAAPPSMETRVCDFCISPYRLEVVARVMRKTHDEYGSERTDVWRDVRTSLTFAILSLRARGEHADAVVLHRLSALTFWGEHPMSSRLSLNTSKPGFLCVPCFFIGTENQQQDWDRQFPCIKAFEPKMTLARKVLVNMTWLFSRHDMNRERTWCSCAAQILWDVQKEIQSAPLQV